MSAFANVLRRAAGALALCHSTVGALLFSCHPAAALYAEVKPTLKGWSGLHRTRQRLGSQADDVRHRRRKGADLVPNGQMFEGKIEHGGVQSALARSLCSMTQVP